MQIELYSELLQQSLLHKLRLCSQIPLPSFLAGLERSIPSSERGSVFQKGHPFWSIGRICALYGGGCEGSRRWGAPRGAGGLKHPSSGAHLCLLPSHPRSSSGPKEPIMCVMSLQMSMMSRPFGYSGVFSFILKATIPTCPKMARCHRAGSSQRWRLHQLTGRAV